MMDGSYIRAHQHAEGAAACSGENDHTIGIGRGGTTSKMHLMVDACGNPLEIIITGCQHRARTDSSCRFGGNGSCQRGQGLRFGQTARTN